MVVQHNLTAMNSNRMLGLTSKAQAKSTEKLSSGYKINRAADDAAGLSISEKMRKQIRGLTQASANAQDGISAVQTAEGALTEVHDMLQRINELAVKASNGTQSESDRKAIQSEVDQLITEIDRVSETTKFNETYLLKGDRDAAMGYSLSYAAVPKTADGAAPIKEVAAGANMATDEATDLTATIAFDSNADANDQNTIAKALRDQGLTISAKQKGNGDTDVESYNVALNGSAANSYKVNKLADGNIGTFEIVNQAGKRVATVTASGGSDASVSAESSAVITAVASGNTKAITAAWKQGDAAQFYDADGNAVSANALGNYFSTLSGAAGTSGLTIDAGTTVYTVSGQSADATTGTADALKALDRGEMLYKADPRVASGVDEDGGALDLAGTPATLDAGVGPGEYKYYAQGATEDVTGVTVDAGWYNTATGASASITATDNEGDVVVVSVNPGAFAATGYNYTPAEGKVAAQAGKQLYDAVGNTIDMNEAAKLVAANKNMTGVLNLNLHVGADATSNNQIELNIEAMSAKGLGLNGLKVDGKSAANALSAVETVKEAIFKVSAQRSTLGAVQNRLEHTINNLDNVVENTTSAESQIRDTDMATEMVRYSNNNILAQAGQAMLAQANQSNQGVLSLLG